MYFEYFSEYVNEKDNDRWVRTYFPVLKDIADGYNTQPGKSKLIKQMKTEIMEVGIPVTMRG